jgi:hypothetical protein
MSQTEMTPEALALLRAGRAALQRLKRDAEDEEAEQRKNREAADNGHWVCMQDAVRAIVPAHLWTYTNLLERPRAWCGLHGMAQTCAFAVLLTLPGCEAVRVQMRHKGGAWTIEPWLTSDGLDTYAVAGLDLEGEEILLDAVGDWQVCGDLALAIARAEEQAIRRKALEDEISDRRKAREEDEQERARLRQDLPETGVMAPEDRIAEAILEIVMRSLAVAAGIRYAVAEALPGEDDPDF